MHILPALYKNGFAEFHGTGLSGVILVPLMKIKIKI